MENKPISDERIYLSNDKLVINSELFELNVMRREASIERVEFRAMRFNIYRLSLIRKLPQEINWQKVKYWEIWESNSQICLPLKCNDFADIISVRWIFRPRKWNGKLNNIFENFYFQIFSFSTLFISLKTKGKKNAKNQLLLYLILLPFLFSSLGKHFNFFGASSYFTWFSSFCRRF